MNPHLFVGLPARKAEQVCRYISAAIFVALLTLGLGSCGGVGSSSGSRNAQPAAEFVYASHGLDSQITVFQVNAQTGALTEISGSPFSLGQQTSAHSVCVGAACDAVPKPLAVDPASRFLYMLDANAPGVRAFSIDRSTGALSTISALAFDVGQNPTDIRTDAAGRFVYVSSDTPGEITGFQIDPGTGALRSIPGSPFATALLPFTLAASTQFLYAASTTSSGSAGIQAYSFDQNTGQLTPVPGEPFGIGEVASIAVDQSGTIVLAAGDVSNTVTSFKVATNTGVLNSTGSETIGVGPTAIAISPGEFAYISTAQGIYPFRIAAGTGTLTPIGPPVMTAGARGVAVDGQGKYLFAVDPQQNTIVSFAVDGATGGLTQVSTTAALPSGFANLATAAPQ